MLNASFRDIDSLMRNMNCLSAKHSKIQFNRFKKCEVQDLETDGRGGSYCSIFIENLRKES